MYIDDLIQHGLVQVIPLDLPLMDLQLYDVYLIKLFLNEVEVMVVVHLHYNQYLYYQNNNLVQMKLNMTV